MLEKVLRNLRNYFVVEGGVHEDHFVISSGTITLDFLQTGQYFWIHGSVFNDGIYQYPATGLHDEEFTGEIWAMAVPPAVIALAGKIATWETKYGDSANSPYSSESFGGYSYSKASGGSNSNSANKPFTWESAFKTELDEWRKI